MYLSSNMYNNVYTYMCTSYIVLLHVCTTHTIYTYYTYTTEIGNARKENHFEQMGYL